MYNLELGGTTGTDIIKWGSCLKDCPVEDFIPACETPPPIPNFPLFDRKLLLFLYCLKNEYNFVIFESL